MNHTYYNAAGSLDNRTYHGDQGTDNDEPVHTTSSNQIHGPLHLPNGNNVGPRPNFANVLRTSTTTTTTPTIVAGPTPAGEDTNERHSHIPTTTNNSCDTAVVTGPAVVLIHNGKNIENEFDVTLTIHDIEGDDFDHIQKGYVNHVPDDLDELHDAVSILSDDIIFDKPSLFACCWCRTRNIVLIAICIITTIVLTGVCSAGHCSNNSSGNATSLASDNGSSCQGENPSSSLAPTGCQQPQQVPTLVPQQTINNDPPNMSPTTVEILPRKAFTSTQELYEAVDEYLSTGIPNLIYGRTIGSWNISLLTNLSNVFNAQDRNPRAMYFNDNLTGWDTSRVTTMETLFLDARAFNGDISTWQTGNVVNMNEMFGRAIIFNGDISNWDISKVTTLARMFGRVTNFNRNLRRWNVSSVEDMSFAFTNCLSFQGLGLDAWDTSKVRTMEGMFLNTPSFNGDLSLWNVSRVTNMKKTFRQATSFNSVLSQWDVSRVSDMTEMFMHALSFNADISSWNVSSVEYAQMAFYAASSFRTDLSNWNVSKMKDLTKMFAAAKNQDHNYCRWGQVLPGDAITQSMFIASGCPIPNDPIQALAEDRLTYCTVCTNFWNSTDAPTQSPSIFGPTAPINGSFLPILNEVELMQAVDAYLENGISSDVVQHYGYPISTWDVSLVKDFSYILACERNIKACDFDEDIGQWNTSSAESMAFMFAGAVLFNRDLSSWTTGKVANMTGMFMGADLFNGDLSSWDTGSVTDMSSMFQTALTYQGVGLSSWDTSSVTTLFATFEEAGSFIGNISEWDTSNVVDLQRTFQYASSFNGDISHWNVSNVKYFSYAFSGASSFNRDLSSWDVSDAQSMIGMFSSAKAFNNDLCSWGPLLNLTLVTSGNLTRGLFTSSACLNTRDPSTTSIAQGPFCHDCSA